MLEALNSIVQFLGSLVNAIAEFNLYTLYFFKFLWKSVSMCVDFLSFIPEPFLHFAFITLIISVIALIIKVVL